MNRARLLTAYSKMLHAQRMFHEVIEEEFSHGDVVTYQHGKSLRKVTVINVNRPPLVWVKGKGALAYLIDAKRLFSSKTFRAKCSGG